MKSFRNFISEEIKIGALASGGIDIERDAVRDEINGILAGISAIPCVTPYNGLYKVRKALSYFHIHLPKKVYLEGRHGIEVWEVKQFGDKMGFTDQGEWIKDVPAKYHLFFHYHLVGSMYYLEAKIVNEDELETRISRAEQMVAEAAEAAVRQDVAKASAPKEPLHDVTSDEKKKGNKEAVADSEKGLDEELSHGARELTLHADNDQQLHRSSHQPIIKNLSRKHAKGTYDHDKAGKLWKYHADRAAKSYEKQHGGKFSVADRKAAASHFADSARDEHGFGSKKIEEGDVAHFVPKPPKRKVKVAGGNKEEIDQQHKKLMTYHKARRKNMKEEQVEEAKMTRKQKDMAVRRFMSHDPKAGESILKMGAKDRAENKSFASAEKEANKWQKHRLKEEEKGDLHKKYPGLSKTKHIKAKDSEGYIKAGLKKSVEAGKNLRAMLDKKTMKEEQIDELKKSTLASYIKKAHVSGLEAASQGEIAYANKDKAGLHKANKTGEKREQGINLAATKLAREEYEKQEAGVKKRSGETHTLHRRNPGHKTEYHTITTDRDGRKSVKTGSPKYIKKHWDKLEETQIDEVSLEKAAKTARLRNIGAERSAHASPYDYSPHIDVQRRKAGKTVDRIGQKYGADKAKKVSDKMEKDTDKVWRGKMGEETISEKAPPGAKFERMVKHIKKGYAKDGELTAKEKGIAFATAWKAKNKESKD